MPFSISGRLPALLLLVVLAGCGFRLAGTANLPPELTQIQLLTRDFSAAQRDLLVDRLRDAGAEVWAEPRAGAVQLRVTLKALPDRRLVTSASSGKTVDRITRRVDFSLVGADGAELAPTRSLTQQKDLLRDDDNLLASGQERRALLNDLEQALFSRLVQQLKRI